MTKPKVFISYRTKDSSINTANPLFDRLTAEGYDVFLDTRVLGGGDDWQDVIYDHAQASDVLLLLLEEDSASDWVKREVDTARGAGVSIIPIRVVRELKLKEILERFALDNTQVIPYQGAPAEWEALLKAITEQAAKTHERQDKWIKKRQNVLRGQRPKAEDNQAYKTYILKDRRTEYPCKIILTSGDMMCVRDIDVLVNSENDYMQMARVFESYTISALLRRHGFHIENYLLEDTVQLALDEQFVIQQKPRPIEIGSVLITHAGHPESRLQTYNRARYIFHTAIAKASYKFQDEQGQYKRGVIPVSDEDGITYCTISTLEKVLLMNRRKGIFSPKGSLWRDGEETNAANYEPIRSIIFPLFGTGHAGLSPHKVMLPMLKGFAQFLRQNKDEPTNTLEAIYLCAFLQEDVALAEQEFPKVFTEV